MSNKQSNQTSARFIMPTILIVLGISLLHFTPGVSSLGQSVVQTVGFSVFATGVFSFITIYNHARNPMATDTVVSNVAQALIVYGGLLTALLYQQILTVGSVVTATVVVFVFSMIVSASAEMRSKSASPETQPQ